VAPYGRACHMNQQRVNVTWILHANIKHVGVNLSVNCYRCRAFMHFLHFFKCRYLKSHFRIRHALFRK